MKLNIPNLKDFPLHLEEIEAGHFKKSKMITLVDTVTGKKPLQTSQVQIGFTKTTLWAIFQLADQDPAATYRNHDEPLYEENAAELFIDPLGTGKVYFELEVNPLNAGFDAIIVNSIQKAGHRGSFFQGLTDWNPDSFRHRVETTPKGWEVVLGIDFEDLFLTKRIPKAGDRWRGNILRIDTTQGKTQYQAWSPTGVADFHNSFAFGEWVFGG